MKIEEQVLTIEQMQHLKELGLEVKDTAMCWIGKLKYEFSINPHTVFEIEVNKGRKYQYHSIVSEFIPTLTLQEILKMLPKEIVYKGKTYSLFIYPTERGYEIGYDFAFDCPFLEDGKDPLIVSYKLLCYMTEKGYLKQK